MSTTAKDTRATIVPCLRYRDAGTAIDWLCQAFGFERRMVLPNEDGSIGHAELSFGNGVIMVSSIFDTPFGRLMKQPDEVGMGVTQSPYLIVEDADRVYRSAVAAGARIELDIKDEDYGGRGFTCRDPEGHLWSVGTYDPWQSRA